MSIRPTPTSTVPPPNAAIPPWLTSLLSKLWIYVVMSAAILLLDYLTGPFLMFPILFVIPITLSAWYYSARCAFVMALLLPLGRFLLVVFFEHSTPTVFALANACVRIAVLSFIAYLVSRTARQTKELQKEITLLEGILHICMYCKRIRNDGQNWEPLEDYICQHSEADFSHGLCPECAVQHFGHSLSGKRSRA